MSPVIAVDGPAASGKGTIARAVARHFGLPYLDTGLLYRAVGLRTLEAGGGAVDAETARRIADALDPEDVEAEGVRSDRAARAASEVAAMGPVRAALRSFQRDFAVRPGGAVLDGRDIGTVICPEADVKLYVTADLDTRTERRLRDLDGSGQGATRETVRRDLADRDARDAARADAPLARAADAHLLDTTELSIDGAVAAAVRIIEQELGRGTA